MAKANPNIVIVAGEASGDLYGACLVDELRRLAPSASFRGMGGTKMRAAGVATVVDADEMAVIGLVEVISHLPVIIRGYRTLARLLRNSRPDLLILIDYQDFNQRLAGYARRLGIPVLFYISPTVWAWRPGRARKMKRLVDHMAVLFPFEVSYYERECVPVTFVGHPLLDLVAPTMSKGEAYTAFGLNPQRTTIGLFPGSRRGEIRSLLGTILDAARLLRKRFPELQFILPLAPSLSRDEIEPLVTATGLDIALVQGEQHNAMLVCDAAISVSGTVTMELALMGVPMVIVYRVSPLTFALGKRLIKVKHIGICNIVAGEGVVPELLQDAASPEAVAGAVVSYLEHPDLAASVRTRLLSVRERLGSGGASTRVARLALTLINEKS